MPFPGARISANFMERGMVGAVVEAVVEPCRLTIAWRFVPCVSMKGVIEDPRGAKKVERTFREW